jgi:hypothetical protein
LHVDILPTIDIDNKISRKSIVFPIISHFNFFIQFSSRRFASYQVQKNQIDDKDKNEKYAKYVFVEIEDIYSVK